MRTTLIFGAALLGAAATFASCGSDDSSSATGADAGLQGPTDLVVTWTFKGAMPTADICTMYMADEIDITLDSTINTAIESTTTGRCADGKVTFPGLLVQDLGMAQLDGVAYDASMMLIASDYVVIQTLALGTTTVNIDFLGAPGAAVSSTSDVAGSSTVATSSTSASTGGNGGAGGTGGAGSTGGAATTNSTTATTTTATTTTATTTTATTTTATTTATTTTATSTTATTSTGAGGGDAG
jgi:hypothetical protein